MSQALSNVFKLHDVINVEDPAFGAKTDGSDASPAIQSAVNTAKARGGGIVELGEGIYSIASGLVVDGNNVMLVGKGSGNLSYSGKPNARASAGTTLKWIGAANTGTMLKFTSDNADSGTGIKKGGGGAIGILLDCQELANIGFEMRSWSDGIFDLAVGWAVQYGYKIWTLSNAFPAGGGASDNQHNTFRRLEYLEINTVKNPVGCIIGTGGQGNTSLNVFNLVRISTDGTGKALEIENADSNWFGFVSVGARNGSGGQCVFHADDTGVLFSDAHCRSNFFGYFSANKGLTVKATIAGTKSSRSNVIAHYSRENGATVPVVETNAHLIYTSVDQNLRPPGDFRLIPTTRIKVVHFQQKSATQVVNNSTTLVNDDQLKLTEIPVTTTVVFRLNIFYDGDATADIKFAFTVPAGATLRWGPIGGTKVDTADAVVAQQTITGSGTAVNFGTAGATVRVLTLEGSMTTGGTSGTLQLQWAQNSAVVADTRVLAGSTMESRILAQ